MKKEEFSSWKNLVVLVVTKYSKNVSPDKVVEMLDVLFEKYKSAEELSRAEDSVLKKVFESLGDPVILSEKVRSFCRKWEQGVSISEIDDLQLN